MTVAPSTALLAFRAAEFCLDWLIDDGKGHLITSPSSSPECEFIAPDGKHYPVGLTSTMDMAITGDLFTNCIEAARILDIDHDFAEKLTAAWARLLPPKIGARGQ